MEKKSDISQIFPTINGVELILSYKLKLSDISQIIATINWTFWHITDFCYSWWFIFPLWFPPSRIVKVWDVRKLKSSGSSSPTPSHQFPYTGTSNRKRGASLSIDAQNNIVVFMSIFSWWSSLCQQKTTQTNKEKTLVDCQ